MNHEAELAVHPKGTAFDLTSLTQTALRKREWKAAGNALKNLKDTQSCLHDLLYAVEIIQFLESSTEAGPNKDELPPAVSGACFGHAILLYARATWKNSERLSLDVRSTLNIKDQAIHDRLIALRKKAIAHLDYDRSYGLKSFADEKLVLVHNGEGGHRLSLADMRISFQDALSRDLQRLLDAAIKVGIDARDRRYLDVEKHLAELSKRHPEIANLIESHPFDALTFFQDHRVADAFLAHGAIGADPDREVVQVDGWPDASERG